VRLTLGTMFVGVMFGFALSRIGFASWDEVHAMFTFASLRLTLAFATAVAVMAVAWLVIARFRGGVGGLRQFHPGTIPGGILFGVGWALTGACPSIALVQLGEGQLAALYTLGGIVLGNYLYSLVHERYFRWTTVGCADG